MIVGVIKTKDLFLNPREVFSIYGLLGTFKVFLKAISRKQYQFIDFLEITTRTFIGRKKRDGSDDSE